MVEEERKEEMEQGNSLCPSMVSFEVQVGSLMTLPEKYELEVVRALGQDRDREQAMYRVKGARRGWEKVVQHRVSMS